MPLSLSDTNTPPVLSKAAGSLLEKIIRSLKRQHLPRSHWIISGERGSGKSTLLKIITAKVNEAQEMLVQWLTLTFPEDSYRVCSPGEFWLEALYLLSEKTGQADLQTIYDEIKHHQNDVVVHSRAFEAVSSYAQAHSLKLLFLVENIDGLFSQFSSKLQMSALSGSLSKANEILVIGTATPPQSAPLFTERRLSGRFNTLTLPGFTREETALLWERDSGIKPDFAWQAAVFSLTRGNPGMIRHLARQFKKRNGMRPSDLVLDLIRHRTAYFRAIIQALPPLERKVFASLAELWEPSSARQIARQARMDVNKSSAYLQRLCSRGAVVETEKQGRKKWYQLNDRWVNHALLIFMNRNGCKRFLSFLHFLDALCLGTVSSTLKIRSLPLPDESPDGYPHPSASLKDFIPFHTVPKSLEAYKIAPDVSGSTQNVHSGTSQSPSTPEDLIDRLQEIEIEISADPKAPMGWFHLGTLLMNDPQRYADAENVLKQTLQLDSSCPGAWFNLSLLLSRIPDRRNDARDACRKALEIQPLDQHIRIHFGCLMALDDTTYDEASQSFIRAIESDPDSFEGWYNLGLLLSGDSLRKEEAEQALKKAVALCPESGQAWLALGCLLHRKSIRFEEAISALTKAIEHGQDASWIVLDLMECQLRCGRMADGFKTLEAFLEINGRTPDTLLRVVAILADHGGTALLSKADELSREAVQQPDRLWQALLVRCIVLGRQGDWNGAFDTLRLLLSQEGGLSQCAESLSCLFLEAASSGQAGRILPLVETLEMPVFLEPVICAVRSYSGKPVKGALEIVETGRALADLLGQDKK